MAFRNRISKGGWKQLSTREEISSNTYARVRRKSPLSNFLEQRSRYDNGLPCYSTFEGEMVWRRYPLPSRVGLLRVFLDMARHLLPCPTRHPTPRMLPTTQEKPTRANTSAKLGVARYACITTHVWCSFIRENWGCASSENEKPWKTPHHFWIAAPFMFFPYSWLGVYLPFMGSINKDKQNSHEYIDIS